MDPRLEIVIETDVVPKGTVDLRALCAPPGARPPNVKTGSDGGVRRLAKSSSEVSALLTSDVVATARKAVRDAADSGAVTRPIPALATAKSDSKADTVPPPGAGTPAASHDARATTVPPPGVPVPTLQDEAADPGLAALDAAANAPIPPRPASAGYPRTPEEPSPSFAFVDHDEAPPPPFETSIGSGTSLAFESVRLLAILLVLTAGLLGLWSYLTDSSASTDVATGQPETSNIIPGPDTPPEDTPPEDTPPEDTPPEDTPPEDTPPEDTPPEDTPPEDTGPSVEEVRAEELQGLREVAARAGTGGEVGVEEDAPGLLAKIQGLRDEAVAAMSGGGLEAAVRALRELVRLAPNDADGLFRLGTALHRLGEPEEAEAHYLKAAAEAPEDARPWNNLSVLQLARGETEASRTSLEKALQLSPEDASVLTNLANQIGAEHPEQAHPLFDKALLSDAEHQEARLGRARARERLGDLAGARGDYRILIEARSRLRPEAYDGLGRLATRNGKHEQAIAYHRRAFQKRGSELPGAQIDLGLALAKAGHSAKAIRVLEQATRDQADSMRAWQALGIVYSQASGDKPYLLMKSKKAYEKAIALGDHWLNHFNYALCAERFGNFPVAILHYEKAIKANAKAWRAYANLAQLYERADRPERALDFVERAIAAVPDVADLHLHRAYLLAQLDRDPEARSALRRFVGLAKPGDPRLEEINSALDGN